MTEKQSQSNNQDEASYEPSEEEYLREMEDLASDFHITPEPDWDAKRKETHEASLRLLAEARERAKRNPDWLKGDL